MRILVVDDDQDISMILELQLTMRGHTIGTASSSEDRAALLDPDYWAGHTWDAVLTDLSMPWPSGVDLVTYLQVAHPDVKVAVITGWDKEASGYRQLEEQGITMLRKPFGVEEILNWLDPDA